MKNLLLLIVSFYVGFSYAQDYKDGGVVINLVNVNGDDLRCDFFNEALLPGGMYGYSDTPPDSRIESLIKSGRYIKSITTTKFGTLVVHAPNIDAIQQLCTKIPSYAIEKEGKKKFKQGWSLRYFNSERGYAIFDKNPNITEQSFVKLCPWKKDFNKVLAKLNDKGLYMTAIGYDKAVAHKGYGNKVQQIAKTIKSYQSNDTFINGVNELAENGWIVSSSGKIFNKFGNYEAYSVIFDKSSNTEIHTFLLESAEDLNSLIRRIGSSYRIDMTWCGWENRNYAREAEMAASYNPDWSGILNGITSGVNSFVSGSSEDISSSPSNGSTGYDNNSSNLSSSSSNSNSSKSNHANWSSLERSYSNYESQLIRISNSSNINKQEVRSIQKKMKEIREKIYKQSGGHQRAISQWENWNP